MGFVLRRNICIVVANSLQANSKVSKIAVFNSFLMFFVLYSSAFSAVNMISFVAVTNVLAYYFLTTTKWYRYTDNSIIFQRYVACSCKK